MIRRIGLTIFENCSEDYSQYAEKIAFNMDKTENENIFFDPE